jgi:hypothetical protein
MPILSKMVSYPTRFRKLEIFSRIDGLDTLDIEFTENKDYETVVASKTTSKPNVISQLLATYQINCLIGYTETEFECFRITKKLEEDEKSFITNKINLFYEHVNDKQPLIIFFSKLVYGLDRIKPNVINVNYKYEHIDDIDTTRIELQPYIANFIKELFPEITCTDVREYFVLQEIAKIKAEDREIIKGSNTEYSITIDNPMLVGIDLYKGKYERYLNKIKLSNPTYNPYGFTENSTLVSITYNTEEPTLIDVENIHSEFLKFKKNRPLIKKSDPTTHITLKLVSPDEQARIIAEEAKEKMVRRHPYSVTINSNRQIGLQLVKIENNTTNIIRFNVQEQQKLGNPYPIIDNSELVGIVYNQPQPQAPKTVNITDTNISKEFANFKEHIRTKIQPDNEDTHVTLNFITTLEAAEAAAAARAVTAVTETSQPLSGGKSRKAKRHRKKSRRNKKTRRKKSRRNKKTHCNKH